MTDLQFPLAAQPAPIQIDNGAASAALAVAKAQEASNDAGAAHADRLAADVDAAATAADRIAVAADKASADASATSAAGSATSATSSATSASGSATSATSSATSASGSATSATSSATSASGSATSALSSLTSLLAKWLGVSAADPTQDGAGNPLVDGALYFSSAVMRLKARISGTWVVAVNTILSTIGAPGAGTGVDGDFAIDPTAAALYGPKAAGAWPAARSLVGPPSPPAGSADGQIQFKVGGVFGASADLHWDNLNGRLGIGTTSPQSKLHIANGFSGAVPLSGTDLTVERSTGGYVSLLGPGTADNGILFGNPTSNADGGIIYDSVSTPRGLQFRTGGNQTRLTINSSGNVGIGTTTPAVKLDVDGPIGIKSYTVATVPSAATKAGQAIYVSNEVGGAVIAFSDGANWLRCTDRAIISA